MVLRRSPRFSKGFQWSSVIRRCSLRLATVRFGSLRFAEVLSGSLGVSQRLRIADFR